MIDFQTLNAFINRVPDNEDANTKDYDDYPEIKVLKDEVQYNFESYAGRKFETVNFFNETKTLVHGASKIYLEALPITKINEIKIDNEVITDYVIDGNGVIFYRSYPVNKQVSIKYLGGFQQIPPDIKRAARLQIIHEIQRQDYLGASSVSENGTNTSFSEIGMLKEVKRILDNYINYGVVGI